MLRCNLLIVGLLAAISVAPEPAAARSRHLGGAVLGLATFPLRMMAHGLRPRLGARHVRSANLPLRRRALAGAGAAAATAALTTNPERADLRFWPDGYEELMGFVLGSPGGDQFWAHGTNAIFGGLFAAPIVPQRGQDQCRDAQSAAESAIDYVQKTVMPTDAQRPAFAEFSAALIDTSTRFSSACAMDTPATPQRRIGFMQDRLWEMRQFAINIRDPLQRFYGLLNAEQRARLNESSEQANIDESGICGGPAQSMTAWRPVQQMLRPADAQRAAFEGLQTAFARASQFTTALCPKIMPATPADRLDAADSRINALTYSLGFIATAMDGFYASLSDQQKKRYPLAPPQRRPAG